MELLCVLPTDKPLSILNAQHFILKLNFYRENSRKIRFKIIIMFSTSLKCLLSHYVQLSVIFVLYNFSCHFVLLFSDRLKKKKKMVLCEYLDSMTLHFLIYIWNTSDLLSFSDHKLLVVSTEPPERLVYRYRGAGDRRKDDRAKKNPVFQFSASVTLYLFLWYKYWYWYLVSARTQIKIPVLQKNVGATLQCNAKKSQLSWICVPRRINLNITG